MASGAKGDEIGKGVSGLPVSVKEVSGPDVMDVQITRGLGTLAAHQAGGVIAGEYGTPLTPPVASVFSVTTPARTIGGVVWPEDRQGATLAGAVEVGVAARDNGRDAVGLAAVGADNQCFGFAVAIDRGAAQGTEDVLSLFGGRLADELGPALLATESAVRGPGAMADLVLTAAEYVVGPEAVNAPAVNLDRRATVGAHGR